MNNLLWCNECNSVEEHIREYTCLKCGNFIQKSSRNVSILDKFFIIYLDEDYKNDKVETSWKIGSKLFDTLKEATEIYNKINESHTCKICKTM